MQEGRKDTSPEVFPSGARMMIDPVPGQTNLDTYDLLNLNNLMSPPCSRSPFSLQARMRTSSLLPCIALLLCAVLFSAVRADDSQELTSQNFEEVVKSGTWFVEHFAPWCQHCKAFAPTWSQLSANFLNYRTTHDFYMAKVDCTTQGDLCEAHKILQYPTIKLYHNGDEVGDYTGDRTLKAVSQYIESSANKYKPTRKVVDRVDPGAAAVPATTPAEEEQRETPNPNGVVVALTAESFRNEVFNRPDRHWFVDMYAPWCQHCKKLAPLWDRLAAELKGKVNVGKVDCTVNKDLCTSYGVRGFPTLKYFADGGAADFRGARKLETFLEFVERASGTALTSITGADLPRLEQEREVFFVYVYDENTPEDNMRTISNAARGFINEIPFYTTSDPVAARHLGLTSFPAAVILKDGARYTYPSSSFAFEDRLILKAWVKKERFPALVTIESDNWEELLRGDRLIVLGVLDTRKPGAFAEQKELLRAAAMKWKDVEELGRTTVKVKALKSKDVQFAWLDGTKSTRYVKRTYGIRAKELPVVIITKPQEEEYFVRDKNGQTLSLQLHDALIEAIIDADAGRLVSESALSLSERTVKWFIRTIVDLRELVVTHPVLSGAIVVAGLFAAWKLIMWSSSSLSVAQAQQGQLLGAVGGKRTDGHRD